MGKWSKKARERQSARLKGYWKAKSEMEGKTFSVADDNGSIEGSVKDKLTQVRVKLGGLIDEVNTIINQLG